MRWTRTSVVDLLKAHGLRPKKALGQNFLVDDNFLDAIVRDAGIGPEDGVVEIGSGIGNLTDRLVARAGHVWAFEIDPELFKLSLEVLGARRNLTILNLDGVEFVRHIDPGACRRLKVVSNLPYAGWQRLLLRLLSTRHDIFSYTLMIQEDVYERLKAKPGTKEYGPMPALIQGACSMKKLRKAGGGLFFPAPRVDSVVIEIRRSDPALDFTAAEAALKKLFAGRRKKSAAAGGRRVEALAPRELLDLAGRS